MAKQIVREVEKLGEVLAIPRVQIRPFEGQPREYFDRSELEGLAGSIKVYGQLVPIEVRHLDPREINGTAHRFELIDGQRRWHASEMAGADYLKATIEKVADSNMQFEMSVVANFNRVGHTPLETARAVARMQENGRKVAYIATACGKSQEWVYQHIKLLTLHQAVRDLMDPSIPEKKRLPLSTALLLHKFPPEVQARLAQKIVKDGLKHSQAKHFISREGKKFGIEVGNPKRKLRANYGALKSFTQRMERDLEPLFAIDEAGYGKMFQFRADSDRAEIIKQAKWGIECLKLILQILEKVKAGGR